MRYLALLALMPSVYDAKVAPQLPQYEDKPARILRMPAPSPDGSNICFSYQGNLWVVSSGGGVATRLTANDCLDLNPRWSPDGKWIAFNSDREGGNQIFIIPAQGGPARQVSFHSVTGTVCDWFPDGKSILIYGNRTTWRQSLYRLDLETGRLRLLISDDLNLRFASLSPDGKWIAFTRGALVDIIRKGYKGAANYDIYVAPADGSAPAKAVSDSDLNDMFPAWGADSKTIYYSSERAGISTLWRQSKDGGRPAQLVSNPPDAIRYVAGSRDGSIFAYECDASIWVRPAEGAAKRLEVVCRTDDKGPRSSNAVYNGSNVSEYRLSPDGKRTVFGIRGDLFVVTNDKGGEAKRLTDHPQRDESPSWAPDGKSIVFSSRRTGDLNLFSVELATLAIKPITSGPGQDRSPLHSPDGKWIAFLRSPQTALYAIRSDGTGETLIAPGPNISEFQWSPDGRWLSYSREDEIRNTDIWVVSFDENGKAGKPLNVSDHPGFNNSARWTGDGSKLLFRSNRYRNRDIETINHQGRYALWSLPLVEEASKFDVDEDVEKPEPPKDDKKKVEVKIDPKEIELRAKQLTSFEDSIGAFAISPDSKWVAFVAAPQNQVDLWIMPVDGGAPTRMNVNAFPGNLQWSPDSQRIYFTSGGAIRFANRMGGGGNVGFTARMQIERLVDYLAVYDEAWQTMNVLFYDKTFRGKDWKVIGAHYRALVPEVKVSSDFQYLITQLLGELNASHTGYSAASAGREAINTAFLGIDEDPDFAGPGVRIKGIMTRSPASKTESLLKEGEVVLEIDGKKVSAGRTYDEAMGDKTGRTVVLKVQGSPGSEIRSVKIKPISNSEWRNLMYEKWIDERREIVEKASGGRLGYLHVNAMGDSQRNRFERELFSMGQRKEGMVLDFRGNNGGDTHDSLLKILARNKAYFTMAPRTEAPFPQPERAYLKPTIVLTDEFSLSDAEVFSNGYKELGLGKVVGNTTMGWIIFTSGRQLLDGSFIRTPYIGCYTMDGRDMENWGVPPDIKVQYTPADYRAGKDAMLVRAVEEVLKDSRLKK